MSPGHQTSFCPDVSKEGSIINTFSFYKFCHNKIKKRGEMMMMMISLYRKGLDSLLSFTADTISPKSCSNQPHDNTNSKLQHSTEEHGLGLVLISDHNNPMQFKSPNILQSSSLPANPTNHPPRLGFVYDVGTDHVDGLMSCTESLGFESSDERLVSDDHMIAVEDDGAGCMVRVPRRRVAERKFPPPLSTLNHHGQPNFYLRPLRKDGRLELTEVRIERTDVLRACRGDGRLRLHLIKDEGTENGGHREKIEEEEKEVQGFVREEKMEFRRCVEAVNQQRRREHHRGHHHQHLDVWRQHCLTTS